MDLIPYMVFQPLILKKPTWNQIMIDVAREVIVVADSSKFLRKSLAFICKLERIDTVITDAGILDEDRKRLVDAGIKVIIA